jgi:VIT1/CCC1 family predicted Fe2+/Mn2+ transporter
MIQLAKHKTMRISCFVRNGVALEFQAAVCDIDPHAHIKTVARITTSWHIGVSPRIKGRFRHRQRCNRKDSGFGAQLFETPGTVFFSREASRMTLRHREYHSIESVGWLRAAVLGANDGIVSTSSLVLGVAATHATHSSILVAGVAGLVAGAMAMATGEYVSVHSQKDAEQAALDQERGELKADVKGELKELAEIYRRRGLDARLARQVAKQLMAHDALGAHASEELGISKTFSARPLQAAFASACSFAVGAALPLSVVTMASETNLIPLVAGTSILFLALLGGVAAYVGGAKVIRGVLRITFWSALSMGLAAGVGSLFGNVA